jgi:predicted RNase H-like HicB family nuclease
MPARKAHFTLEYWTDDGWYVGRLREIPAVMSQGETLEDLEENIRDAYSMLRQTGAPSPRRKVKTKDIRLSLA